MDPASLQSPTVTSLGKRLIAIAKHVSRRCIGFNRRVTLLVRRKHYPESRGTQEPNRKLPSHGLPDLVTAAVGPPVATAHEPRLRVNYGTVAQPSV